MTERPGTKTRVVVRRLERGELSIKDDALATEEPLEIRVLHRRQRVWQTVTMRTPGADFELAVGLLYSEGLIDSSAAIARITYCTALNSGSNSDSKSGAANRAASRFGTRQEQMYNIVNVSLHTAPNLESLDAFRVASSACGVCGKASLDAVTARGLQAIQSSLRLEPEVMFGLPDKLRAAQGVFDVTGGLHAAAAFTPSGKLLCVREDVGRHNALDKLIGWSVLNGVPLEGTVVLVSGRIGFEIAQKAIAARVPVLCAIGAPSSLAVQLAVQFDLTMVGFLRGERANLYSAPERLETDSSTN